MWDEDSAYIEMLAKEVRACLSPRMLTVNVSAPCRANACATRQSEEKPTQMVPHRTRPQFKSRFPLHVTLRIRRDVRAMRTQHCFKAMERAFWTGGNKYGLRLVHFAVMNDHIHMMVEAEGKESLSKAMHALNIRIARAVNRAQQRRGNVLADHYHADILRSPTHVVRVRTYLLTNAAKHYNLVGADPFAPVTALYEPQTWLLNNCLGRGRSSTNQTIVANG